MFMDADIAQIEGHGLTVETVEAQLRRFREGFPPIELQRPSRVGDGILRLSESEQAIYVTAYEKAAQAGRLSKFVPASGAASRMFPGLAKPDLPKGLIPFHQYPSSSRTAFEEHLVEAGAYIRDANGKCRVHFTLSPQYREKVGKFLKPFEADYEISLSEQDASTDTIAVTLNNEPFRNGNNQLVFRPSGHGALIGNLNSLQGDIIYIKNIDNVLPETRQQAVVFHQKVLGGLLVTLQQENKAIDRPVRICGVVPNVGEPGGGPFWVRDPDGNVSLQIVEEAQIDSNDSEQVVIWQQATHFNPVNLVCGVRDHQGQPFDLLDFVDEEAGLITHKTIGDQPIKALERPGLWNGAMARWHTVFVEVPLSTFSPVKTPEDLLRPEHKV